MVTIHQKTGREYNGYDYDSYWYYVISIDGQQIGDKEYSCYDSAISYLDPNYVATDGFGRLFSYQGKMYLYTPTNVSGKEKQELSPLSYDDIYSSVILPLEALVEKLQFRVEEQINDIKGLVYRSITQGTKQHEN